MSESAIFGRRISGASMRRGTVRSAAASRGGGGYPGLPPRPPLPPRPQLPSLESPYSSGYEQLSGSYSEDYAPPQGGMPLDLDAIAEQVAANIGASFGGVVDFDDDDDVADGFGLLVPVTPQLRLETAATDVLSGASDPSERRAMAPRAVGFLNLTGRTIGSTKIVLTPQIFDAIRTAQRVMDGKDALSGARAPTFGGAVAGRQVEVENLARWFMKDSRSAALPNFSSRVARDFLGRMERVAAEGDVKFTAPILQAVRAAERVVVGEGSDAAGSRDFPHFGAHAPDPRYPHPVWIDDEPTQPPSTFVESAKTGAGIGIGVLGAVAIVGLLAGAFGGR